MKVSPFLAYYLAKRERGLHGRTLIHYGARCFFVSHPRPSSSSRNHNKQYHQIRAKEKHKQFSQLLFPEMGKHVNQLPNGWLFFSLATFFSLSLVALFIVNYGVGKRQQQYIHRTKEKKMIFIFVKTESEFRLFLPEK